MSRITVLSHRDELTLLYTLMPLLTSRHRGAFQYTRSLEDILGPDRNRKLLLFRFRRHTPDADEAVEILRRCRDKYERIIYFDDRAGADDLFSRGFEHVDLYYKKQVARDRSWYLRPLWGRRRHSDYYHREFGIEDSSPTLRPAVPEEHLHKLRVSWNLGLGLYPKSKRRRRVAMFLEDRLGPRPLRMLFHGLPRLPSGPRQPFVSARFQPRGRHPRESVAYQRVLFTRAVEDDPRFRTGTLRQREYDREIREARATLSPFGYGEVCFRDFEAIVSGSTLVKPAMEHVETWPAVYRDGETYVSVDWDAKDVVARCAALLDDPGRGQRMAKNAYDTLSDAYRQVEAKVERLLEDFSG